MDGGGSSEASAGSGTVRDLLRGALPAAIKARDDVAVSALRSALAAIENAEAVEPRAPDGGEPAPFGTTEVERRPLSETQTEDIVRAEAAARRSAAEGYERAGERDRAERLRAEAGVLCAHLADRSRPG